MNTRPTPSPVLARWNTTNHAATHAPQPAEAQRPAQRIAPRPTRALPSLVGKAGRRVLSEPRLLSEPRP